MLKYIYIYIFYSILLDDVCFENAKLKRSDQIRTLSRLQDGVIKLNNISTAIDPLVLFGRLPALVERQEDIRFQFFYELTPEPTSLFKDGLMRKPTKSTLHNHLLKDVPSTTNVAKSCVVDGGALLNKVQWLPKCTYNELADHYVSFVKRKYGKHEHICVVFDGYDDILSTKTHEHARRKGTASSNVNITHDSMQVTAKREVFLRNSRNKVQLIKLLKRQLASSGIASYVSVGDADVMIVEKAINFASDKTDVAVVADDSYRHSYSFDVSLEARNGRNILLYRKEGIKEENSGSLRD